MSPIQSLPPSSAHFERMAGLAVENHQAQLGAVEVELPATALDYLVVALVSCDFQPVMFGEGLDSRH